jgi:Lantibiotic biosynthesis dehydratase C-term
VQDSTLSRWQAFHFYYHGRQNLLLEHLLRPLVGALLKRGELDSFFFVRFFLGGPHIRLRLRLRGSKETVADEVQRAAERFFSDFPSRTPLSEDEIRRASHAILENDREEWDESIYPDNSVREAPFRPEIERYGGLDLLPDSLAFFALSSCQALRFFHRHQGNPGPKLLTFAFHLLGCHALEFAQDPVEFLELIRYPVGNWDIAPPLLVKRGDQAFEQQRSGFLRALWCMIEDVAEERPRREDAAAPLRLNWSLQKSVARRKILSSQLHMTANRLGLRNGEEVYVARIVWRAATELAGSEPMLWKRLERCMAERSVPPIDHCSLEDLLPAAFKEFCTE